MRTTLDLNDDLVKAAKQKALDEGSTLTAVIEQALSLLFTHEPAPEAYHLDLLVVEGRRVPGVDLADRDALYELMEGR